MNELVEAINQLTLKLGGFSGGLLFVLWLLLLFKKMGGQNDNQKKLIVKQLQLIEKKLGCFTEINIGDINQQIIKRFKKQ